MSAHTLRVLRNVAICVFLEDADGIMRVSELVLSDLIAVCKLDDNFFEVVSSRVHLRLKVEFDGTLRAISRESHINFKVNIILRSGLNADIAILLALFDGLDAIE